MTRRHDRDRIQHMLSHAEEAAALVIGRARNDLDSDRLLNLALVRLLEIVGEAAVRVGEEFRLKHSEIPWMQIAGLRNRLIHRYDEVDFDILWDIVSFDLPLLIAELRRLLAS